MSGITSPYKITVDKPWKFMVHDKTTMDYSVINIDKIFSVLHKLGFDLTTSRLQGNKIIISLANELSVDWVLHDPQDIAQGYKERITRKGKAQKIPCSLPYILNQHYNRANTGKKQFHSLTTIKGSKELLASEEIARGSQKIKHVHGLNQYKDRKVAAFDIDSHPFKDTPEEYHRARQKAFRTLKYLLKEFKYNKPLFVEISPTGGFHVYFEFNQVIKENEINLWIQSFNTRYNLNLEFAYSTKVLQLPDSVSYKPIRIDKMNEKELTFTNFTSVEEYQESILTSKSIVDYNTIIKEKVNESNRAIYANTYTSLNNHSQRFEFSAHERVNAIFNGGLGFWAYRVSNGNYEQYKDLILKHDIGSIDIKEKGPDKILRPIFENAELKYDGTKVKKPARTSGMADNSKYLDVNHDFLKQIARIINQKYFNYKYHKCSNDNIDTIYKLLQSIFGRIAFEKATGYKRKVVAQHFSEQKKKDYETGYIFYREVREDLKQKYDIKLDMRKVYNRLMYVLSELNILTEYGQHCGIEGFEIQKRWVLVKKFENNKLINYILLKLINEIKDIYIEKKLNCIVKNSCDSISENTIINLEDYKKFRPPDS